MDIKEKCELATRFIESCFDENNEGDGLTFDQRVNLRKRELSPEIEGIVSGAQSWCDENGFVANNDDELEELEELDDEDLVNFVEINGEWYTEEELEELEELE